MNVPKLNGEISGGQRLVCRGSCVGGGSNRRAGFELSVSERVYITIFYEYV